MKGRVEVLHEINVCVEENRYDCVRKTIKSLMGEIGDTITK